MYCTGHPYLIIFLATNTTDMSIVEVLPRLGEMLLPGQERARMAMSKLMPTMDMADINSGRGHT